MKKKLLCIVVFLILVGVLSVNPKILRSQDYEQKLLSETFSGKTAILNELMVAQSEVLINMYGFTDFDFIPVLMNLEKRGVSVKLILEEAPYLAETENFNIRDMLKKYGIVTRWAKQDFFLTHAKYIVIDGKIAIVLSGNITYSSFAKNREFGIVLNNQQYASVLRNLFYADFERKDFENTSEDVLISPIDSRSKIENALKSATSSIKIWQQELLDPSIISILREQKQKGIDVKVIMPLSYAAGAKNELGTAIYALPNPYVHAKAFIIDDKYAYIGSNNFSTPSFDTEREVGIFTHDNSVINELLLIWNWDMSHSELP